MIVFSLCFRGYEGSLERAVHQASLSCGALIFEQPNQFIHSFAASIQDFCVLPSKSSGRAAINSRLGVVFETTTIERRPKFSSKSQQSTTEKGLGYEKNKKKSLGSAIGPNNLLLRGSKIRNTPWVLGLVAYAGEETKVMMNSRSTRAKLSTVQRTVNSMLLIIFIAMLCLTTISVVVTHFFREGMGWDGYQYTLLWYINNPQIQSYGQGSTSVLLSGPYVSWLGDWLTFFVLYNNFIPISLYVTLEICNFFQAMWINNDIKMYYSQLNLPALVRSSSLSQVPF